MARKAFGEKPVRSQRVWRETRALECWAAEFLAMKKTWHRVVPGLSLLHVSSLESQTMLAH